MKILSLLLMLAFIVPLAAYSCSSDTNNPTTSAYRIIDIRTISPSGDNYGVSPTSTPNPTPTRTPTPTPSLPHTNYVTPTPTITYNVDTYRTITIDKIGVLDDKEHAIAEPGDIYVYVSVSNGMGQPVTVRIPSSDVIQMEDNQVRDVNRQVWSGIVSGDLRMVVIAFESDPEIHALLRSIIISELTGYLGGGLEGNAAGYLIESALTGDEDVSELAECSEDDLVGAIEKKWTSASSWGKGSYADVRGGDLRLWFTIK